MSIDLVIHGAIGIRPKLSIDWFIIPIDIFSVSYAGIRRTQRIHIEKSEKYVIIYVIYGNGLTARPAMRAPAALLLKAGSAEKRCRRAVRAGS